MIDKPKRVRSTNQSHPAAATVRTADEVKDSTIFKIKNFTSAVVETNNSIDYCIIINEIEKEGQTTRRSIAQTKTYMN